MGFKRKINNKRIAAEAVDFWAGLKEEMTKELGRIPTAKELERAKIEIRWEYFKKEHKILIEKT